MGGWPEKAAQSFVVNSPFNACEAGAMGWQKNAYGATADELARAGIEDHASVMRFTSPTVENLNENEYGGGITKYMLAAGSWTGTSKSGLKETAPLQ